MDKYRDYKGRHKAVVLPFDAAVVTLHKFYAETVSGWDLYFWSQHSDPLLAKADFEAHYEALENLEFQKSGIPLRDLGGSHYFSFVLPDWAGTYCFLKRVDGEVMSLCLPPPEYSGDTIVEDLGLSVVIQ